MSYSFDDEIHIDVEVRFKYDRGTKAKFDKSEEQYYPGDDADISDVQVIARMRFEDLKAAYEKATRETRKGEFVEIDISSALSATERENIEQDCFSHAADETEPDY